MRSGSVREKARNSLKNKNDAVHNLLHLCKCIPGKCIACISSEVFLLFFFPTCERVARYYAPYKEVHSVHLRSNARKGANNNKFFKICIYIINVLLASKEIVDKYKMMSFFISKQSKWKTNKVSREFFANYTWILP